MEETIGLLVLGVAAVVAAALASRRAGLAAPLILVALGGVVGLLPFVPPVALEPEWILTVILPPLLYSAAVSLPAVEFRREVGAISCLSVLLVVISALVLGWFFTLAIPGLSYAWGVALGAIVSPTDAVAVAIVKRMGVSLRVVTLLEGEGLLNDATALVLLRAATVAAVAGWSVGGVIRDFILAAALAGLIGYLVGKANLWLRSRTTEAAVNTAISLIVPFAASLPAEHLDASGLVAAVVAGIVTGRGAPGLLSPQHRLSDAAVWRTVELLLEGAVFLLMGLELYGLLVELREDDHDPGRTIVVALLAWVLVIAVRAAFVVPLLLALSRRARRGQAARSRVDSLRRLTQDPERFAATLKARVAAKPKAGEPQARPPWWARLLARTARRGGLRIGPRSAERFRLRFSRRLADIDYVLGEPIGPREGAVVVWAGMRGAVTLAAAQTLPGSAPDRSLLVFLAFVVATVSLLGQGATLGTLVRWVHPATVDAEAMAAEQTQLAKVLAATAQRIRTDAEEAGEKPDIIGVIDAQRGVLLDFAREGTFATTTLRHAMSQLDAKQIALELRGRPVEEA